MLVYSWPQGILILARQENRECCVFILDVLTTGIYLSLTLGSVIFKQQDHLCSLSFFHLTIVVSAVILLHIFHIFHIFFFYFLLFLHQNFFIMLGYIT